MLQVEQISFCGAMRPSMSGGRLRFSKEDGNGDVYGMTFAMFSQIVVEDGVILLTGCC